MKSNKVVKIKAGESYWYINITPIKFTPSFDEDCNASNCFRTKEDADAMAHKLCAVLKGADVIEMPSVEEYEKIIPQRIGCSDEFAAGEGNGYKCGYNYIKSKIVK